MIVKKIKLSKIKGFTLIELLVVVSIIGVLTAVLLVNLVGIRERGADTKKKSDLNQMRTALRLFYNDNQSYPAQGSGNTIMACGADGTAACVFCETEGTCTQTSEMNNGLGTIYMKRVPNYIEYSVSADRETYYVGILLTNASDPEAAASATKCGVPAGSITTGAFYVCTD